MQTLKVNYHNDTKYVLLFIAVKSGSDVDLAPGVESKDDAGGKKQTVERTCKGKY